MARTPRNWAEIEERLADLYGGGEHGSATARELLQEVVLARWGVESLFDLARWQRQVAFQKSAGFMLELQEHAAYEGDLAFAADGVRDLTRATAARFFDGVAITGPPWRLDPSEADQPLYEEAVALADFA